MKKSFGIFCVAIMALLLSTSCERVAPNYQGVLMKSFGKNGKADFSLVKGKVPTWAPGTELFQVPLYELRGDYGDRVLHLKAADNTEFSSRPMYSFKVIESRSIDVVFENKQLGSGDDFMTALEDNILETKIYDIMKEASRGFSTETLMATTITNGITTSGSLVYEKAVQEIVKRDFEAKGLELITFSCQLEFTEAVTKKIDSRNEVNTNISVIEQQIVEQTKKLELARITAQIEMVPLVVAKNNGVLDEYVKIKAYEIWGGKQPLYGGTSLMKSLQ